MLDIEKTRRVKHIVVHRNGPESPCPDGTAAALLLRDALPDARITFANHVEVGGVAPEPDMLFCDVTPTRATVDAFVEVDPIVLDHHVQAKDIVARFRNGVYSDEPGVSGATLAFHHVWNRVKTREPYVVNDALHFARLAGVRDTFQQKSPDWRKACAQAEALKFYPWEHLERLGDPFGDEYDDLLADLAIGEVLLKRRDKNSRASAAQAYRFMTAKGTRVAVISTVETSDVVDLVADTADLLVGFMYLGTDNAPKIVLSFRSRGHDVGELAKALGGGGHKQAAGATIPAGTVQPYALIEDVVRRHERTSERPIRVDGPPGAPYSSTYTPKP